MTFFKNKPEDEEVGRKTAERFEAALKEWRPEEPLWFIGIEHASSKLDLLGVDYIAYVKYPGIRALVRIPVQLKSSSWWIEKYHRQHPDAKEAGVLVFIVRPEHKQKNIRRHFFNALGAIRNKKKRFEAYLDSLEGSPVQSTLMQRIYALNVMRGVTPTQHQPLRFLPPPMSKAEAIYYRARRAVTKAVTSVVTRVATRVSAL